MAYSSKNSDKNLLIQPPRYDSQEFNDNDNNNAGTPLQVRMDPTNKTSNTTSPINNQDQTGNGINAQSKNSFTSIANTQPTGHNPIVLSIGQTTENPPIDPAVLSAKYPLSEKLGSSNLEEAIGPQEVICPFCNHRVETTIQHQPGNATYTTAIICCCILGIIGLMIACCAECYQDIMHYCPNCGKALKRYERSF